VSLAECRSTDDLFAPPAAAAEAIRRQRRRRMRTRVIGVAGTAAAAGLAVGTLASSSGQGARPAQAGRGGSPATSQAVPARLTAAQKTLFGLSAAAAGLSGPRPRNAGDGTGRRRLSRRVPLTASR
jgi:hypothetical protein